MADVTFDDLPAKPSPNQYDPLFERHGRAFGIDPLLLKAQARVESGLDPQAQSGVGAQGLMQLMPINQRRFGVTNPFDPDQNIRGAAALQQENMKRAEGDPAMALAYYHGGPNIAQHGPRTLAYRDRVLGEYERLKTKPQDVTFDDLPPAKEEGTGGRGLLGVAKDIGIGAGQGVIQFPGSIYSLGNAVTGGALDRGTKALSAAVEGGEGESFSEKVNRSQQILADVLGQSKELTAKQRELNRISNDPNAAVGDSEWGKQFNSFVTGFGYVLMNPDLAANMFAQSVPSMVGMAGVTRKATEVALAKKLSEKSVTRVGEWANVLTNAVMEGGDSAGQTKQSIMQMDFKDLEAGSDDYRQLRAAGKTPEQAREEIADKASRIAAIVGGLIGGGASKLTGAAKFESQVFGKGTGKIAKGAAGLAGNVAREATEEGLQNAGDQFAQNVGTKVHAKATQDLAEGVAGAAGPGAALGALTGGAFHGVGMIGGKTAPDQVPPPPPPSLQFGDKKVTSTPELQAHLESIKPEERHAALAQALGLKPEDEGHAALKNVLDLVAPEHHASAVGSKFFGDVEIPKPHTPVTDTNFEATVEAGIKKLHAARADLVANHPEGEALSREQEQQLRSLDQRILALQDQGTKSLLADAKTIFNAAKNSPSIFTTIRDAVNQMPEHAKPTVEKLVADLEADPKAIFAHATQTPDIVRTVAKAVDASFSLKENKQHGQENKTATVASDEGRDGRNRAVVGGQEASNNVAPKEGAISATGIHYSQAPRQVLSSHHYGTGMTGAEAARVQQATDARLKKRLYFYVNAGEGIKQEKYVGSHAHRAPLTNLYDADSDHLNLADSSKDHNAFESAVLDHGYHGYVTRAYHSAVLLGSHNVKAEHLGLNADVSKTPAIAAANLSEDRLVAQALIADKTLPSGEMTGKEWATRIKNLSPEIAARLDKLGITEWLRGQDSPMYKSDIVRNFNEAQAPSLKLSEDKTKHPAFKHLTEEEISNLRNGTAEKFVKMYSELPSAEEMAAVAYAGGAKRGWYARAVQAIIDVYGIDAPRFAALLASMSPQTNVKDNFEMARHVWDAWVKAGRPTTVDGIVKAMRAGLKDRGKAGILPAWLNNTVRTFKSEDPSSLVISGPKVNSFMRNLQGDVNEVTNDGWMAAFANIDKLMFQGVLTKGGNPGKRPVYLAMNAKVRSAAKILSKLTGENWTPAEVQETIWSWAKTLYELQERAGEKRGARQLLADGELTDKLIASTPDFGRMFANHAKFKVILDKAEARRSRGSDQAHANEGAVARGEAAPFAGETQARHERRAAGRLEQLREQRLADEANKRIREEVSFSRKSNAVTVEEARGTGTDAAIDDLNRIVKSYLGKDAPQGAMFERAAAGKAEAHLSQAIGKVFGKKIVFFRNVDQDSFFFDGMAAKPEVGGRIYLNIDAANPFLNTTGHEFLHQLRVDNPKLYNQLVKEIWKHFDENKVAKHWEQTRKLYEEHKLSNDKILEEVVADVAGDVMATKEFWQDISKRESSLFRSLADIIIKFLNSAAEKLRGTFGTEKFIKDIDAVRSAVVGAYVEWARQSPQYKDAIKRPSFEEWFGDSVLKDKNGPQVFYHGTARDFKQFKPKQAGAIFFTASPRFAEDFSANSLLWVADQISTQQMLEKYGEPGDKELLDKQEFQNYMNSAPTIYPVFLKAEMPFDWENRDHIGQLDSWLDSEYAPNLGEAGNSEFHKDQLAAKDTLLNYKSPAKLLDAVANGDWTAIEHPIVQKFIRSQGFDSFYTQEALLKNIAVLNPNQVKSVFSTNFETSPDFSIKPGSLVNDLFSDSGKKYLGSTPRQRTLYIKQGERALDQINKWIGNRLSPLGAMPNEGLYTVQRGVMMGLIAKADETAGKIGDIFNKATDADRKAVYEYWTTSFGRNTAIVDPEVRQTAVDVKKQIADIGDMLAKRGLVDAKDIAANRGKYVPRLYLKHLLNEADWRAVGAGKSLSDLGYTKKRKDIPEHIRLALLGEIREPGFLGAMAIGKPLRDIAILDFLDTMSKNKDWAWDGSVTTHNGQRVSVPWLKNEAIRLEEQAAYYDDPALKKAAMDEAEAMRKVYLPLEAKAGKVSEDFSQIPDTPRYGLLRGMWVRKEIREDLIGSAHLNTNGTGWAENFFGYGGIGTKLTQAWKTSKVALNPPGQVRNFISNMILLHLSGVPMHMIPMRLGQAVQAIRTKNKYWDIAQKYGITEGTYGAQELYRLERELLEDKGEGGPFAFLRHAKKIASFAGDVYQKMEEIGKIAKIIDEMEAGSDETHAVLQAQRWLFDYSLVPKSVRFLRNNPIGIPFMTFYYKLAPRLLEVALTAPHRFVPYIGAAYLLPMLVAGMVGATPDDLEKLKKALPEWLRDKQHVYVLPERDSTGRWQFLDLSYLMPWTMFTDAARQVKDGKFSDLMSTTGLFTGPVIDLVQAIRTNIDPFTKREIANKGDPVNLQVGSWLTWLYNEAMPPVLTNRGLIGPDLGDPNYNFGGKVHQNLFSTTNKYGEAKQTNAQTISSAFGVNVYPINPRTSRISEMQRMQAQMMDAERLLVQKLGDKGLSPEARQNTIDTYRAEMRKRVDAIKKYATESQVPANLQ